MIKYRIALFGLLSLVLMALFIISGCGETSGTLPTSNMSSSQPNISYLYPAYGEIQTKNDPSSLPDTPPISTSIIEQALKGEKQCRVFLNGCYERCRDLLNSNCSQYAVCTENCLSTNDNCIGAVGVATGTYEEGVSYQNDILARLNLERGCRAANIYHGENNCRDTIESDCLSYAACTNSNFLNYNNCLVQS